MRSLREKLGQFLLRCGLWVARGKWPEVVMAHGWSREQAERAKRELDACNREAEELARKVVAEIKASEAYVPRVIRQYAPPADDTLELPPMTGHEPPKGCN